MTDKLDAMMARIQKLLRVADDPATPEEAAASYRAKAESLMAEWRIEEEQLIAEDQFSILPTLKKFVLCDGNSPYRGWYAQMWVSIAEHCGVRSTIRYEYGDDDHPIATVTVVGYASDIRYAEFLWSATRLMFAAKMEPQVDPNLSEAENVYRLRSAGLERNRISKLMWGTPNHEKRVTRLYLQACRERGEEPQVAGRDVRAKDYRVVYARSFAWRLDKRLADARNAVAQMHGLPELAGRQERVDELFYSKFPHLRPKPAPEPQPCEACARTKHESGLCRLHRPRKVTKQDTARWNRLWASEAARRAYEAGTAAADAVVLSRTERTEEVASGAPVAELS